MSKLLRWVKRALFYDEVADLVAFNRRFSLPVPSWPRKLSEPLIDGRLKFIEEELIELRLAQEANDLVGVADALVDLVYVIKGTAVQLGLPWEALWQEVHATNMRKVLSGAGPRYKRGISKPPGWQPPRVEQLLRKHGWSGP